MRVISAVIEDRGGRRRVEMPVRDLVLAGWTGRDKAAMEHHIAELEALGVKRPATTPIYYRASAARVTTEPAIEVVGTDTSGEVEFVLAALGDEMLVGVGSDHTDRKAETYGVTLSKQLCEKPVAPTFWPLADVIDHWDDMIVRAFITTGGKRELYQEGPLARMLPPQELIRGCSGDAVLPDGTVLFGGTLAAIGAIRGADHFAGELEDPRLRRRISFGYDVHCLPVRG
jgi:hypothetical protein